jgi:hypothetical protein
MPKATKKATKRKRTTLENLPAKVKDVSGKDANRLKGGAQGTLPRSLTINGNSMR